MTHLSTMFQTGNRDVWREIETLPRHVQDSGTSKGCRKTLKKPRKAAVEHKKGAKW